MTHADLAGAVLNGADLTYAVLNSADRTGASMIGTRLDHTDLTQTVGLTEEQIVLTVPSRSVMLRVDGTIRRRQGLAAGNDVAGAGLLTPGAPSPCSVSTPAGDPAATDSPTDTRDFPYSLAEGHRRAWSRPLRRPGTTARRRRRRSPSPITSSNGSGGAEFGRPKRCLRPSIRTAGRVACDFLRRETEGTPARSPLTGGRSNW
ncbi:pentapeptide repeat-containing protein [Streptomyces microflavus]|uniref:pentapeptide repeat-containing protein n=1 Tax=Streptomyces microflavus TaxID=1919 RepID=UPI003657E63F